MAYYKGTIEQLEAYNNEVTLGEKYQKGTTQWAEVIEINGEFYMPLNEKYSSDLEKINEIPIINE